MRGLYGLKSEILKYIARYEANIDDIARPLDCSVTVDMPYAVCDVTISLRFMQDENGLVIENMNTKENLIGFFNPIPPFKLEHDYPVLCVIYMKTSVNDEVHIQYFNDSEEVRIIS